jgi:hypothetical protein
MRIYDIAIYIITREEVVDIGSKGWEKETAKQNEGEAVCSHDWDVLSQFNSRSFSKFP